MNLEDPGEQKHTTPPATVGGVVFFTRLKLWLTLLLHLGAFLLVLMVQLSLQYPGLTPISAEYVAALGQAFGKSFSTPAAQLLAAFLIFAPLWAVFITRKALWYGNFVWVLTVIWSVLITLFFVGIIKIQPWLYWFLYAAFMLFFGMVGILYRVFSNQETVQTGLRDD